MHKGISKLKYMHHTRSVCVCVSVCMTAADLRALWILWAFENFDLFSPLTHSHTHTQIDKRAFKLAMLTQSFLFFGYFTCAAIAMTKLIFCNTLMPHGSCLLPPACSTCHILACNNNNNHAYFDNTHGTYRKCKTNGNYKMAAAITKF